jgi:hypothetical protein
MTSPIPIMDSMDCWTQKFSQTGTHTTGHASVGTEYAHLLTNGGVLRSSWTTGWLPLRPFRICRKAFHEQADSNAQTAGLTSSVNL